MALRAMETNSCPHVARLRYTTTGGMGMDSPNTPWAGMGACGGVKRKPLRACSTMCSCWRRTPDPNVQDTTLQSTASRAT
eukprot:8279768-Pyramimonas_sp.AAC.1